MGSGTRSSSRRRAVKRRTPGCRAILPSNGCLRIHVIEEYADELVDEDNFTRYLPLVAEAPPPIYLEDSFTDLAALENSPWKYEVIAPSKTAELIRANDYLIRL